MATLSHRNRGYAFDVTRPRDQADRHIEWQKVYRSGCATACLCRFIAMGRVVALLGVQTGTIKVRIKASAVFQWNRTGEQDGLQQ